MINSRALIGVASGWGAQNQSTELGAEYLQRAGVEQALVVEGLTCYWHSILFPTERAKDSGKKPFEKRAVLVSQLCKRLAKATAEIIQSDQCPIILGGDHSMALGTWSGVTQALNNRRKFGLIWFDAHMDAHTRETSPSDAIYGMPVALLLGYGDKVLLECMGQGPILDPKHIVLVGVRSYEEGEALLLKKLGVTLYFMHDIVQRGLATVMTEALQIVTQGPDGFGVSIDLDGFDPSFVPGVGAPVPNGINPQEAYLELKKWFHHPQFRALEIAEFNPTLDKKDKTVKVIQNILLQS